MRPGLPSTQLSMTVNYVNIILLEQMLHARSPLPHPTNVPHNTPNAAGCQHGNGAKAVLAPAHHWERGAHRFWLQCFRMADTCCTVDGRSTTWLRPR